MAGKTVVALLLLALVVAASAVSTQKAVARKRDIMVNQAIAQAPSSLPPSVTCPICIQFMVAAINFYLNEWLQITLPNTCQELCATVDPTHENQCNLMCNIYGVYAFIQVLSRVDIDPIYMCQLDKQCPFQDCKTGTCASISAVTIHPQPIKSGDTITITGYYSVNGTAGAGMLRMEGATAVDGGWTIGPTDYLVSEYTPGTYKAVYEYDSTSMQPGHWNATFHVCQGGCGSVWPGSKLFAEHTVYFQVPN